MKIFFKKSLSAVNNFLIVFRKIIDEFPIFIILIVGMYYQVILFSNLKIDTTSITNTFFAICATLSALSFSYCRTIDESNEEKKLLREAGEDFFHSSILLICASIIKYAILSFDENNIVSFLINIYNFLKNIIGILVGLLYLNALISAHDGLTILNKILLSKIRLNKNK